MPFSKKLRRGQILSAAVAGIGLLVAADPVRALSITLVYNAGASTEPAADPTGAALTSIMNHVVSQYEDIFETAHNLTINYWYENLASPNLAVHNLVSQAGGRETVGNIRFDPDAQGNSWFFDPTPSTDTEFNMSQVLWRDLTATEQADFYNPGANIPQTFEAGFRGSGNGSDPNTAGNTDQVSVAFHEVGHALGMSSANTTTIAETGDLDYDFDSVNIFGVTLGVEHADAGNIAHLESTYALMNPSIGTNFRDRPSHSDLLAMAAVHNYTALDIPRREYYGGSDWNTDANWTGNTIPSTADTAFIRAAGPAGEARTAGLSAAAGVGTLFVSEGGNFQTNAFALTAFNAIVIDGLDTDFFVEAGGTLTMSTATLTVQNQGELNMSGGVVNAGTLSNRAEIIGDGVINVTNRLINAGSLNVVSGTMTINATGTGSIDLDGFNTGTIIIIGEPGDVAVTAANSDLVVNGLLTDNFNGSMTIGNSNSVTMNDPWTIGGAGGGTIILGVDGVLNLNGGSTTATAAVLAGATVTIQGDVNVLGAANTGRIEAPVIFDSANGGAEVVVNGTLELSGSTTYEGGSHTGTGQLFWDGPVTFTGNTTIDIDELDMDGFVPFSTVTVSEGVTATINSNSISLGGAADPHSGSLTILGTMNVNTATPWGLDGSLTLNSGTLGGSAAVNFAGANVLNTVNSGDSAINSDATFTATSQVTANLLSTLRLQGGTSISGGTWGGLGTLSFGDQNTTFAGSTTLNTSSVNLDGLLFGTGSVNLNSLVTVVVNGSITDAFDATLNVNSATFTVNGGPWTNSGIINLRDTGAGAATINGQPLTNDTGGVINISGGTNAPGIGAGDDGVGGPEGGTGGGVIATGTFINSGSINVATNSIGQIAGNITFNATSNVIINTGGELELQGPTTYFGGSYTGPGTLTQDSGAMTVAANTTIDVDTYDWDGGFFSTTTVNPGVTFTINSNVIDDDGVNDPYESVITVNSGSLIVNTAAPWPLSGQLNLTDTGAGDSFLGGQAVQLVAGGTIQTTAGASSAAAVLFNNGNINVVSAGFTINGSFRGLAGGSLTKSGPGLLTIAGAQGHAASSLFIDNGNVTMLTDAGAGGANLSVLHSGTALTLSGSQHLARLAIDTGATATMAGAGNDNLLREGSLDITGGAAPTGTLNLADETMILDYAGASPLIAVRDWLLSGYNANTWTGDGIRSSAAAADPNNRALGYAEASAIGSPATFAGEAIDATTVLVRFTIPGDVNLDRSVDLGDFAIVAANFNTPQFWSGGDFDFNFFTDLGDFALLAAHFNQVLPADLPRGGLVPEPVAALALATAALGLRRRR